MISYGKTIEIMILLIRNFRFEFLRMIKNLIGRTINKKGPQNSWIRIQSRLQYKYLSPSFKKRRFKMKFKVIWHWFEPILKHKRVRKVYTSYYDLAKTLWLNSDNPATFIFKYWWFIVISDTRLIIKLKWIKICSHNS